MTIHVLYEDNHIIAVNKSSSDIVQGDKTGDMPLSEEVKLYLKKKYNKPGDVFWGGASSRPSRQWGSGLCQNEQSLVALE